MKTPRLAPLASLLRGLLLLATLHTYAWGWPYPNPHITYTNLERELKEIEKRINYHRLRSEWDQVAELRLTVKAIQKKMKNLKLEKTIIEHQNNIRRLERQLAEAEARGGETNQRVSQRALRDRIQEFQRNLIGFYNEKDELIKDEIAQKTGVMDLERRISLVDNQDDLGRLRTLQIEREVLKKRMERVLDPDYFEARRQLNLQLRNVAETFDNLAVLEQQVRYTGRHRIVFIQASDPFLTGNSAEVIQKIHQLVGEAGEGVTYYINAADDEAFNLTETIRNSANEHNIRGIDIIGVAKESDLYGKRIGTMNGLLLLDDFDADARIPMAQLAANLTDIVGIPVEYHFFGRPITMADELQLFKDKLSPKRFRQLKFNVILHDFDTNPANFRTAISAMQRRNIERVQRMLKDPDFLRQRLSILDGERHSMSATDFSGKLGKYLVCGGSVLGLWGIISTTMEVQEELSSGDRRVFDLSQEPEARGGR